MPLFKRRAAEPPADEDVFLDEALDAHNSIFLSSLEELTPDDLAPAKKPTLYDRVYNGIRTLLMVVCACVFCYCLWMLVDTQVQSAATGSFYEDLAGQIFADEADLPGTGITRMIQPTSESALPVFADAQLAEDTADLPGVTATKTYNLELERMKAFLSDLCAENPDVFGYIRIDGTAISYPLVKGRDDEYYLHHQSNGQPSVSGAIYADTRCNTNLLEDRNLILYGHNMTNGTMFNNVTKFFDSNVFYNTKIVIYTFDGIYTYEPFAIFSTNARYPYFTTYFPEPQTMIDFCNQMQANSRHNRGLTFTGDEQLLTLSTCTNLGDGRYALHARLIKVEQ
ncbi:MAG: class B sortase [Clostridia bacterium]|nr:class B sortase [Clostridia bacterium]